MAKQIKEPKVEINPEPVRMISFLVGDKFKEDLKVKCIRNGETISEVARRLLENYLNESDKKIKRRKLKTKKVL
ncbi:hypothetical protein [Clostridium beijerinckii]|uniref:CopG family transcriptional regulator n=1 Tax=Clostridium beijerinckii TaxID=1520 RepID=A0A1S9MZS0_CLOBE|nr:hypothetical protein [Clostridium beijerinckii]MDG5854076.1 hypothetical protein [Clostridium beijerinckii]MZK50480.1 hypothetical protein [Clostridium beijerinckii]MZK58684.1 hypothetical protein [Clostridium beijerinckii]MZK68684.1 hypothetical protein [Clostridium beijerinckii]MZK74054.1 hypothetical protein [Clostridium beijerinckii]